MTDKEKLSNMIYNASPRLVEEEASQLASRLIKNGVTVQKHGRWVKESNEAYSDACEAYITWTTYLCSECDIELMSSFKYCPNCGCRMDKDGE